MTRYRIERLNLEQLAAVVVLLGTGLVVIVALVLLVLKGWFLP